MNFLTKKKKESDQLFWVYTPNSDNVLGELIGEKI